ncbi:MAG: DegT/DnrJ/EryC1/StrS family aminotransferase [Chloroflexi bacterium]|nr:DegT/DnrJ/EryC1/StrS family aminotransferase [Chloroflexota bacterium]MCL5026414.1 DegT/DnrJ/EryC1/StrS family aminotransferase [Chloroflexota bacterium]
MIPVFRPSITEAEIEAVAEVLRSGWWGLGPKTHQFEQEFASFIGARYAVGLNSATAALHLGLHVLDVEGGEVITTPMTFISTNHAILYNRAIPVFADIRPDTLNIDVADIERKITPRTKAIMTMHYGGHPCEIDEILALARPRGIKVIEDAAHACGAEYKGRRIGSHTDAACFSFHAVKNLATGEGGALSVQDPELEGRLRRLRWMGITKDTWERSEDLTKYSWYYNVEEVGFKCHMNDIPAAIGLVQLRRLPETNARRRSIAERYNAGFAGLEWLERPVERPYVKSSFHNYVVKVPDRDRFTAYLQQNGIATSVHYIPNHLYSMYKPYYTPLPVAEDIWHRIVTLPLFPDLTDEQVDHVIGVVQAFGREVAPVRRA